MFNHGKIQLAEFHNDTCWLCLAQISSTHADALGMEPVIPSKRNRKEQRDHDRELYRARHLVENAFLHLKQWRGIATRYAKNTSSFVAEVQIRCAYMWASIL